MYSYICVNRKQQRVTEYGDSRARVTWVWKVWLFYCLRGWADASPYIEGICGEMEKLQNENNDVLLLSLMRGINAVMCVRYIHLSDRHSRVTHVSISEYVSTHSRGSATGTITIMTAVFPSLPWRWKEGKKIPSALLALCSTTPEPPFASSLVISACSWGMQSSDNLNGRKPREEPSQLYPGNT